MPESAQKLWLRLQKGEVISMRAIDDDTQLDLYLTGACKTQGEHIVIRNRIYEELFTIKVLSYELVRRTEEANIERISLSNLTDEPVLSVIQMSAGEIGSLTEIIAGLPNLTDAGLRGWRILLESADLGVLVRDLNLTGDPKSVAWQVLNRLKGHHRIPEKPDHEVLGLLLSHIATLPDLPTSDCAHIKGIIMKYRLVPPSLQL